MGLNLFVGGSAGESFSLFPLRGESYAKKRPGSDHPKYPGLPLINHGSPRSQTWVFWVGKGRVVRRSLPIAQETAGQTSRNPLKEKDFRLSPCGFRKKS